MDGLFTMASALSSIGAMRADIGRFPAPVALGAVRCRKISDTNLNYWPPRADNQLSGTFRLAFICPVRTVVGLLRYRLPLRCSRRSRRSTFRVASTS